MDRQHFQPLIFTVQFSWMCMILALHTSFIFTDGWLSQKFRTVQFPLPPHTCINLYRINIILAFRLTHQTMHMNTFMKPWNAFLSKVVSCNRLASTILQPLCDTSSASSAPPSALALPPNIASLTSVFSVVSYMYMYKDYHTHAALAYLVLSIQWNLLVKDIWGPAHFVLNCPLIRRFFFPEAKITSKV